MQALKALVILMGVLIVAGVGLLAYGLMTRTGEDGAEGGQASSGSETPRQSSPLEEFGTLELALPDGCVVAGSELSGDRLVVRFSGQVERGCQQVVVIDLASGRVLGRVKALSAGSQTPP